MSKLFLPSTCPICGEVFDRYKAWEHAEEVHDITIFQQRRETTFEQDIDNFLNMTEKDYAAFLLGRLA